MTATDLQDRYDDAMFLYSQGGYDEALSMLRGILAADPAHFDSQLAAAMCLYRKGDYGAAILEGHKAEQLRPSEQLVHTNLSLFYMKAGDKLTAEKHGLKARVAGWKENLQTPAATAAEADPELKMAQAPLQSIKTPERFPDMPWKKKQPPARPPTSP